VTHKYGDERIVEWLSENEYHPRSPAHGSASCMFLLDDLLHESEKFREAAADGEIVYQEDYTVGEGPSRWNTDLVVGPPMDEVQSSLGGNGDIQEAEPERIWLAIDAKSVMTEHQKARKNRQRDINSFADIMHRHHPGAVTGGLLLINMASEFRSPLRDEGDITSHDDVENLVQETVEMFRDIDRANGDVGPNVDGVGCVVVEHTNKDDGHNTRLVTEPPAPQPGDMVNYREFLEIITETLEDRWLTGEPPELTSMAEIDDLQAELNRQTVSVAHSAHMVDSFIDDDELSEDNIEKLQNELAGLESLSEEIKREYID